MRLKAIQVLNHRHRQEAGYCMSMVWADHFFGLMFSLAESGFNRVVRQPIPSTADTSCDWDTPLTLAGPVRGLSR